MPCNISMPRYCYLTPPRPDAKMAKKSTLRAPSPALLPQPGVMTAATTLFIDVLTILPFCGWAIMSIAAVPSYAALAWAAPVVGAVFSTLLCACATYEMWQRSHGLRQRFYLVVGAAAPPRARVCSTGRWKGAVAAFFLLVSLGWAVLSLVTMVLVIVPEEVTSPHAICYLIHGENGWPGGPPDSTYPDVTVADELAQRSGAIAIVVQQIPNSPVLYPSDPDQVHRKEDVGEL